MGPEGVRVFPEGPADDQGPGVGRAGQGHDKGEPTS